MDKIFPLISLLQTRYSSRTRGGKEGGRKGKIKEMEGWREKEREEGREGEGS